MKNKAGTTGISNRREQISKIATKLFADKGFRGASLDDVAEQLEVTRASLYYHIKSKEDLLREICEKIMKDSISDTQKILSRKLNPKEKLRMYIREQVLATAERPEVCAVLFEQVDALKTKSRNRVRKQMRMFDQMLVRILDEGVKTGEFDIEDTRIASFAIHGTCFWLYHWYRPDGRLSKEEISDHIIRLLENGYLKSSSGKVVSKRRPRAKKITGNPEL